MKSRPQRAVLATIFLIVCLGLGYPTLNRYDIRSAQPDAAQYASMVTSGARGVIPAYRARVLVPYLAKPFARLARGHVGSWDPVSFGLLVANSLLTAGAAYILVTIGVSITGNFQTAFVAALLYLLNFEVSNQMLAGMVDSGEAFFLVVATALLLKRRWQLLPIIAVFGAASKETFVPLLAVFAGTWALASPARRWPLIWTAVSVAAGLATVTTLLSLSAGQAVWPWSFASGLLKSGDHVHSAIASLTSRTFWYVFVWLLPLGLVKIRSLPRPWVLACAAAALVAIALSAYHNAPRDAGAAVRPLFSIAGPLLSLSAALALCSPEQQREAQA